MSLQGKILSFSYDKHTAKVLVKPVADCNGCKACAGLIQSSNAANSECEIEALTNYLDLKEGDIVKVEMSENQRSKAAILIYGVPLIGFLAGLFIVVSFGHLLNIVVIDLYKVIGAFIGLFISFLFIVVFFKVMKPESFIMTITEIINNKKEEVAENHE